MKSGMFSNGSCAGLSSSSRSMCRRELHFQCRWSPVRTFSQPIRISLDMVAVLRAAAGHDPYDKGLSDLVGRAAGPAANRARNRTVSSFSVLHPLG